MTSYKDALVLLNDLEEFANVHELPEGENLIAEAREAIETDLGRTLPPIRKPASFVQVTLIK